MRGRPIAAVAGAVLALALAAWGVVAIARRDGPRAAAGQPPAAVPRPPVADLDPEVAAAIRIAAAAVEADRSDGSLWGKLGRVYESAEYYTLARTCYEAAQPLDPASAEWPYHLGRLAADRGEPEEAARHFEEALRLDPGSLPARLRLADARLRLGDLAGAESLYAEVQTQAPQASWGPLGMARVRRRQGQVEEARRLLEEALAIEPRDREASYLLATIYNELGRAGDARAQMARFQTDAVAQWPPDPLLDRVNGEAVGVQVTLRRANRLLTEGRLDEAEPLYDEVLATRPDEFVALINLGNLALRKGETSRAIELLEHAVSQRPEDPHPRFGLAMAYLADGRPERGAAELEEVVRLDPRHQQARAMAERARAGAVPPRLPPG